jgi:hypothetical protein
MHPKLTLEFEGFRDLIKARHGLAPADVQRVRGTALAEPGLKRDAYDPDVALLTARG